MPGLSFYHPARLLAKRLALQRCFPVEVFTPELPAPLIVNKSSYHLHTYVGRALRQYMATSDEGRCLLPIDNRSFLTLPGLVNFQKDETEAFRFYR